MEKESNYLVRSAKLVFGYLTELIKKRCILSAQFGENNQSFLTTIIALDQKANLLTIDIGPTEELNQQLLNAAKVLFRTEYDGVKVSFRGKSIKKTKIKGLWVFAMPIPEALFWMQRRQYYRAKVPLSHKNSFCEIVFNIKNEDGSCDSQSVVFNLADISISGFAFFNPEPQFTEYLQPNSQRTECSLYLHDGSQSKVGFVVKNLTSVRSTATADQHRIGCMFTDLPKAFESNIQHYIYEIELQQKNIG